MNRVMPPNVLTSLLAALVAAGVAASPALAQATRCDTLASHPFDPDKVAPGVKFTDLNARDAIAACTAALKRDDKNPRLRFELGRALERSGAYGEAVKVYRIAADTGYVAAQNALGAMYQDGLGVAPDANEAVAWYRKAAEQGYAVAEDNLGTAYREGRGVAKDEAQALAWFKKAAAQFYQPAAAKLAALSTPAPAPTPAALPAAPPPPPSVAALAPPPSPPLQDVTTAGAVDDPQFKSELGVALTQCILPEARNGNYAAIDDGKAADLLIGKCLRPWVAWVSDCVKNGDTQEACIRKSNAFARTTIRQLTQ